MSEAITINRREKRKASGKGTSLLYDLEDDFSDIEKNFKLETYSPLINEAKTKTDSITKWLKTENEVDQKQVETGNKVVTNREQTGNKLVTNEAVNWEQTSNKLVTEVSSKMETGNKVVTKPVTELVTKWEQTSNKLVTIPSFSELIGLQKNLIIFIYNSCKLERNKSTQALTLEHLTDTFKVSAGTVKTTIRRLERKDCIKRISFKNGRGGWSKYELSESLFMEMLQLESGNKLVTNWEQTGNKLVSQLVTEPVTSLPSSSSLINTTTNYRADALAETNIQLTDSLVMVGFNQGHIEQLLRDSSLGQEEIQNSLNAFAFDLGFEDVKRKVRSPIGLIMKLLKNGQAYISEKGYESEEDRLYRELIERAEKKKEEKTKLEAKLINIKFEEWLENTSDEEKRNLVTPMGEFMGLIHREELKEYFKKEVYNANSFN
jgi:predicted transcriptional regulator